MPTLFQNTIFHGEQDAEIKALRHEGSLAARLERARELKDTGNKALKTASPQPNPVGAPSKPRPTETENLLREKVQQVEAEIVSKEKELKALRQQLNSLKAELERQSSKDDGSSAQLVRPIEESSFKKQLEAAISTYEKAAGLLR